MPFIRECIVTTIRDDNSIHIAPMGIHDDVRVYAGCITGRRDWPTSSTDVIIGARLDNCLAHTELEVIDKEDDEVRPKYFCKVVHEATHQAFHGYNRAQSAVLELAILTSRLKMLPKEKIQQEIEYLTIGYEKTSGSREQEAWGWLMEKINDHMRQKNIDKDQMS